MKLSAPIHVLKSKAKELKRSKSMSMAEALNEVARSEGYSSWSLPQSKTKDLHPKKREEILDYLNPGDLMLIGSRPGLGKTAFALQIILQAAREGRKCYFFSLEYTHKDVASKVAKLDESVGQNSPDLTFDFSDEISSDYIVDQTVNDITEGSLVAIDYLQILDQQRKKPDLQSQLEKLKEYARNKKCILIFISQIDRSFEESKKDRPDLDDIRLPNPVDLSLFNKTMFLHDGKIFFKSPSEFEMDSLEFI